MLSAHEPFTFPCRMCNRTDATLGKRTDMWGPWTAAAHLKVSMSGVDVWVSDSRRPHALPFPLCLVDPSCQLDLLLPCNKPSGAAGAESGRGYSLSLSGRALGIYTKAVIASPIIPLIPVSSTARTRAPCASRRHH